MDPNLDLNFQGFEPCSFLNKCNGINWEYDSDESFYQHSHKCIIPPHCPDISCIWNYFSHLFFSQFIIYFYDWIKWISSTGCIYKPIGCSLAHFILTLMFWLLFSSFSFPILCAVTPSQPSNCTLAELGNTIT